MPQRLDRLYYELALETKDFDRNIKGAEKALIGLGRTIMKYPVASIATLVSGLGAAALAAARFADKTDAAMRRAATRIPGATAVVDALRKRIQSLSSEIPIAHDQLVEMFDAVGRAGVSGPGEAVVMLEKAAQASVALGEQGSKVVEVMDQVQDAFGLAAGHLGTLTDAMVLAQQNGVGLDLLGAVVERLGARARAAGVSHEELIAATIAYSKAGVGQKQIMTELGREIDSNSGQLQLAGVAAANYQAALDGVRNSAGLTAQKFKEATNTLSAQEQLLRNQVAEAWRELGFKILPAVKAALDGVLESMHLLGGDRERDRALLAIETITKAWDKLTDKGRVRDLQRLHGEMSRFGNISAEAARSFSDRELKALREAIVIMRSMERDTPERLREARFRALQNVEAEIARRGPTFGDTGAEAGAGAGGPPPRILTEEQRQAQRKMIEDARAEAVQATVTLVDDLQLQLERMNQAATETFTNVGTAVPKAVTEQMDRLRALIGKPGSPGIVGQMEALEAEIDRIADATKTLDDEIERHGEQVGFELLSAIQNAHIKTEALLGTLKEGTVEHERVKDLLQKQKDLMDKIHKAAVGTADATADEKKNRSEIIRNLQAQAHKIQTAAQGAIQLAQAFQLIDASAAAALSSISQIAANFGLAKAGDFSGIMGVIGGVASLVGSLFGESPAARAHKELLKRNSDAIEELTRTLGEFGLAITGDQFLGVQRALSAASARAGGTLPGGTLNRASEALVREELARIGLTMADLREVAAAAGVELDGTAASLRQLQTALTEIELAQFTQSFQGQMTALRAEFELFDIDDPIRQLQRLAEVLSNKKFGAPALREALAGLDLSTPEGRRLAEEAVQNLFRMMQSGDLDAAALGGLTAQEFLDQLLQLEQLIEQGNVSTGTSQSFGIDRSITEITGSRIAAYLSTSAALDRMQLERLIEIRDLLASLVFRGGVQPPTMEELNRVPSLGGPSVSITIQQLVIQAPAGTTDPAGFGRVAGDALVERVNQAFGGRGRRSGRNDGGRQMPLVS